MTKQARNWIANAHYDPMATLATWESGPVHLGRRLCRGRHSRQAPAFSHAFAGLVSLADWIASQATADAFPFDLAPVDSRWEVASRRAREVLQAKRIDVTGIRHWLRQIKPEFGDVFRDPVTSLPYQPTALQQAMADPTLGPLVIVEAETGSGKTEAALWRQVSFFKKGQPVSSCPRVSAKQTEIEKFMAALFPEMFSVPDVLLSPLPAVDGIERRSGCPTSGPRPTTLTTPAPIVLARGGRSRPGRSMRGGRYRSGVAVWLACASCAPAWLLACRAACWWLMRYMPDRYMIRILQHVLRGTWTGGHALLSATLGMAARDGLMARQRIARAGGLTRRSAAYPAITDCGDHAARLRPPCKSGTQLRPWINDPAVIAKHTPSSPRRSPRADQRNSAHGAIQVKWNWRN